MTTPWTSPTTIIQYSETGAENVHISWFDQDNFSALLNQNGRFVSTTAPLLHIARQPRNDITMKTWYLQCTGYNFSNLPDTISGVAMRLTMNRGGRITDETVQLSYQNNAIGLNKANLGLDPQQTYGGMTDIWEIADIDASMIQDPSFGVVLRFQSHPMWPHRTAPGIDAVELQIS